MSLGNVTFWCLDGDGMETAHQSERQQLDFSICRTLQMRRSVECSLFGSECLLGWENRRDKQGFRLVS